MRKEKWEKLLHEKEISECETEIKDIRSHLDDAYLRFDSTSDFDSIDACVFEINALRARYNAALRHMRDIYFN